MTRAPHLLIVVAVLEKRRGMQKGLLDGAVANLFMVG